MYHDQLFSLNVLFKSYVLQACKKEFLSSICHYTEELVTWSCVLLLSVFFLFWRWWRIPLPLFLITCCYNDDSAKKIVISTILPFDFNDISLFWFVDDVTCFVILNLQICIFFVSWLSYSCIIVKFRWNVSLVTCCCLSWRQYVMQIGTIRSIYKGVAVMHYTKILLP